MDDLRTYQDGWARVVTVATDSSNTSTIIIIAAGTITFTNEWYQTKQVNWRIPLATIIAGLVVDGVSHLNDKAAIGLSVMVFLGAITARFNGKSVVDTITTSFSQPKTPTQPKVKSL